MSTSVSLIIFSASSSVSFSPTFFYTCRAASHGSSPRQTTRCPRSCGTSTVFCTSWFVVNVVGGNRLRHHVCRKTCVLDCLGDASWHVDFPICDVGVVPLTASPLFGPQCTVGVLAGTHWGASDARAGWHREKRQTLWLRCVRGGGHVMWKLLIHAFFKHTSSTCEVQLLSLRVVSVLR